VHQSATWWNEYTARNPPRVSERRVSHTKACACTAQRDAYVARYADTTDGDIDADRDANSSYPNAHATNVDAAARHPYCVRQRL
jgi:hypothetical protein